MALVQLAQPSCSTCL